MLERAQIDGNVRLRLHGDIVRIEVDGNAFLRVLEIKDEDNQRPKGTGISIYHSGSGGLSVWKYGYKNRKK